MGLKDFIAGPIVLIIIILLAYLIRPYVTNKRTKRFFIPALTIKIGGALALGLIYQFYYGGGDTFGYTTQGSSLVYDSFWDSPLTSLKLIFGSNVLQPDTFKYSSRILYFNDPQSYFVVRVASILSIIVFDSYSSIAILFAAISFSALWTVFTKINSIYDTITFQLAIAFFMIPSVVFWGSGVMKDTLTLSALCMAVYALINIFYFDHNRRTSILILITSFYLIYSIKIYILLCFIPSAILWIYLLKIKEIKSTVLKILIFPFLAIMALSLSYISITFVGENNPKYSIQNVLVTAEITAKDNSIWTVRKEGSGYNLGDYDFSPSGILAKFFPAVVVTLFRPYLWEVKNPLMLLSAIESFLLILFITYLILSKGLWKLLRYITFDSNVLFFIIFTISFAFAIGISSGNFGSLVRYKIPILPFFLTALFILQKYSGKTEKPSRPLR